MQKHVPNCFYIGPAGPITIQRTQRLTAAFRLSSAGNFPSRST